MSWLRAVPGSGPVPAGGGSHQPVRLRRTALLGMLVALLAAVAAHPSAAVAQADRTLRIFPIPPTLAPGESVELRAWFCRVPDEGLLFGTDAVPGTDDDRCEQARGVRWSVEDRRTARVRPERGTRTTLTGRRDGLTTLRGQYQATATSSFVHAVPVTVTEPDAAGSGGDSGNGAGAGDGGTGAGAGESERPGSGVPVSIIVQPGFAALTPGDPQLFVAYVCPLLGVGDPRGPDASPGTGDDFCRLAQDAGWSTLGEPSIGTFEPTAGPYVIFRAGDSGQSGSEASQPGPRSGAVTARIGDQEGAASVGIDAAAETSEDRIPGDVDGDGDVDQSDLSRILDAFGWERGDSRYDEAADFDANGSVGDADLRVLLSEFGVRT